jgi:hypothetical protein
MKLQEVATLDLYFFTCCALLKLFLRSNSVKQTFCSRSYKTFFFANKDFFPFCADKLAFYVTHRKKLVIVK